MIEETIYIYGLINPLNNQVFYIGASTCPKHRINVHNNDTNGYPDKILVINEIKKSGEKIELLILDECRKSNVRFLEEFYIDLFTSYGFNLLQKRKSEYSIRMRTGAYIVSSKEHEKSITFFAVGRFMGIEYKSTTRFIKNGKETKETAINRTHNSYLDKIELTLISNNISFKRVGRNFYYN